MRAGDTRKLRVTGGACLEPRIVIRGLLTPVTAHPHDRHDRGGPHGTKQARGLGPTLGPGAGLGWGYWPSFQLPAQARWRAGEGARLAVLERVGALPTGARTRDVMMISMIGGGGGGDGGGGDDE